MENKEQECKEQKSKELEYNKLITVKFTHPIKGDFVGFKFPHPIKVPKFITDKDNVILYVVCELLGLEKEYYIKENKNEKEK